MIFKWILTFIIYLFFLFWSLLIFIFKFVFLLVLIGLFCFLLWWFYFLLIVFIKKVRKIFNLIIGWWNLFCYVVYSFNLVLSYMLELFIYDLIIFVIGILVFNIYKVSRLIFTYSIFFNLITLHYIEASFYIFDFLTFLMGVHVFRIFILLIVYFQLKRLIASLIHLNIKRFFNYTFILFFTFFFYLILDVLLHIFCINNNFTFAQAPLLYFSLYIFLFYIFFFYFCVLQLFLLVSFFIFKNKYFEIKKCLSVQDFYYFLFFFVCFSFLCYPNFLFLLFSPLDFILQDGVLGDFLNRYLDFQEILNSEELNSENFKSS